MPSRNEISATIGSASAPTRSQMRQTSFQRTRRRMPHARSTSAAAVSPTNVDLLAHVVATMPAAMAPISSTAGRRGGSRIEVVLERRRVELVQQRRRTRASGSRPRRRPSRGCAQQVDEQRDAGAVAVIDVGCIDDDALSGAAAIARRLSSHTPRIVVASRRPDSARMRRPSVASEIASAAISACSRGVPGRTSPPRNAHLRHRKLA